MQPLPDIDVDLFDYTTDIRKQIVNGFFCEGKVTADPKEVKVVLSALKDIDHQILTRARIAADDQNSHDDRATALQIAEISEQMARKASNPFRRVDQIPKAEDGVLPKVKFVVGELEVGSITDTYDEFMARIDSGINKDEG